MNAIGRVFLVLNLGLAGAFVAFAGSYLQRAADWKDKFEKLETSSEQVVAGLRTSLAGVREKFNDSQNSNNGLVIKNTGLENTNKEKDDVNVRLQARVSSTEASLKTTESYMATIDSRINAAVTNSQSAMKMSIQAEKDKDAAVAAKNAADKALADANFRIKNQGDDIANKIGLIARHEGTIKEKDVLLEIVNRRYPGIFTTLHPHVAGNVSHVSASGKLVTIDLTSGAALLKAGHTFAVFSAKDGYKGEVVVSEIDEGKKYCFGRVSLAQGKKIEAGDSASTDVSRSGNN